VKSLSLIMLKIIVFVICEQLKKCGELNNYLEDIDSQQNHELCKEYSLILEFLDLETRYLDIFSLALDPIY
jgi:hypothetical protein